MALCAKKDTRLYPNLWVALHPETLFVILNCISVGPDEFSHHKCYNRYE
jgi:hypothetical protein